MLQHALLFILVLIVVGVLLWWVDGTPINAFIKRTIYAIAVIAVVVSAFSIFLGVHLLH